jgi:uncharacterized protein (TIGR02466 family)
VLKFAFMEGGKLLDVEAENAEACAPVGSLSGVKYNSVFTTPLLTQVWGLAPQLNPPLRERILAHEAESHGVAKSNDGGWHSDVGQLEFCGEAGQRLIEHARALADEGTRRVLAEHGRKMPPMQWAVYAWANVNRAGDFNKTHVHPASTWSGTYYVDSGDPLDEAAGTPLHLMEPSQGRIMSFLPNLLPSSIYLRPRPGLIVLFPSYVPHMVLPHAGGGTRISIAFNLRREPYP